MSIRLVRQVEAGYRFVGTVDSAEAAARLVESGLATMKGSGRNAVLVMKEEVAPSGGGAVGQGGVKYTYRETYSRGPLHVLKRCVGGKYERWDNDLTFDELLLAFDKILKEENYYSQTVVKLVSQIQYDNIEIDAFDKQILFHLSKGTKTKDIPQYVPLSLSAVEKRKLNLKEILDINGGSDIDLIKEAKNKGMI
jgi:hypothetical protein